MDQISLGRSRPGVRRSRWRCGVPMSEESGRGWSCLDPIHDPIGGAMGRIVRSRAGRRMFVGVLALAGLALVACEPLKPPPESPPAELPQICIPNQGGDPRALAEPAPTEPACTPICVLIPPGSPGACERVPEK